MSFQHLTGVLPRLRWSDCVLSGSLALRILGHKLAQVLFLGHLLVPGMLLQYINTALL